MNIYCRRCLPTWICVFLGFFLTRHNFSNINPLKFKYFLIFKILIAIKCPIFTFIFFALSCVDCLIHILFFIYHLSQFSRTIFFFIYSFGNYQSGYYDDDYSAPNKRMKGNDAFHLFFFDNDIDKEIYSSYLICVKLNK